MSTTLERMAEAIYHSAGTVCLLAAKDAARSALLAIREPGPSIQDAGWEASVENEACTPECCWVAMIDAIRDEGVT